jgi:hypothetical protein
LIVLLLSLINRLVLFLVLMWLTLRVHTLPFRRLALVCQKEGKGRESSVGSALWSNGDDKMKSDGGGAMATTTLTTSDNGTNDATGDDVDNQG